MRGFHGSEEKTWPESVSLGKQVGTAWAGLCLLLLSGSEEC